jgi:lysophospholipase L1-like esterase
VQTWWGNVTGTTVGAAASSAQAGGTIGNNAALNFPSMLLASAFIEYGRALSATEQANARVALNQTFGIQPQVQDIWVADGDSITQGYRDTALQTYPEKARRLITMPLRVYNTAYYGQTMADRISRFSYNIQPIYNPKARNFMVSIFAGTNDIVASNATGASIYANIVSYVAAVHALGSNARCIVAEMLPRAGLTAGQTTQWQALNALIDANTAGSDYVVHLTQDPTMGPASATANTALYADGTHPTDAGYSYLAPWFAAAVTSQLR